MPRRLGSVRARRGVFAIFIAQHPRRRRALTPASGGRPTAVGVGTCATLMGPRECWLWKAGPAPAESRPCPPPNADGAGARDGGGPRRARGRGASDPEGQGPEPRSHGDHSASIARHPARLEARAGAGNHKGGRVGRKEMAPQVGVATSKGRESDFLVSF